MQRLRPEALVLLVVLSLIAPQGGQPLRALILIYIRASQHLPDTLYAVHDGQLRRGREAYAQPAGRLKVGHARTQLTHRYVMRRYVLAVAVAFFSQDFRVVHEPLAEAS